MRWILKLLCDETYMCGVCDVSLRCTTCSPCVSIPPCRLTGSTARCPYDPWRRWARPWQTHVCVWMRSHPLFYRRISLFSRHQCRACQSIRTLWVTDYVKKTLCNESQRKYVPLSKAHLPTLYSEHVYKLSTFYSGFAPICVAATTSYTVIPLFLNSVCVMHVAAVITSTFVDMNCHGGTVALHLTPHATTYTLVRTVWVWLCKCNH